MPASSERRACRGLAIALLLTALVFGCKTRSPNAHPLSHQAEPKVSPAPATLSVGDTVEITFRGDKSPFLRQRINENGEIILFSNLTVKADGETTNTLAKSIHDLCVPLFMKGIYVTVRQVNPPGIYFIQSNRGLERHPWVPGLTVLRAIARSRGFSEFSREKVEILRADGTRQPVNWKRALRDPKLDYLIYPGDTILIGRRWTM